METAQSWTANSKYKYVTCTVRFSMLAFHSTAFCEEKKRQNQEEKMFAMERTRCVPCLSNSDVSSRWILFIVPVEGSVKISLWLVQLKNVLKNTIQLRFVSNERLALLVELLERSLNF